MAEEFNDVCCCVGILLPVVLASTLVIWSLASKGGKKEAKPSLSQMLVSSGIIPPTEEVIESVQSAYIKEFGNVLKKGICHTLVLTDKRLLLVDKPPGNNPEGFIMVFYSSLNDIMSITPLGGGDNQLLLMIRISNVFEKLIINLKDAELFSKRVVEAKNSIVVKETVVAKTVIIEEAKKDKAEEILKKRFAKGEITKEEFHDKILRM